MLNVTMELMNRPPLTTDAVIMWERAMQDFSINDIRAALDGWCDSQKKAPRPAEIRELIQNTNRRKEAFKQLPEPKIDREQQRANIQKLQSMVATQLKPKTNYHSWFIRILKRPKDFPEESVQKAINAARSFGYDLNTLEVKA